MSRFPQIAVPTRKPQSTVAIADSQFSTRLEKERSYEEEPAYIWTVLVSDSARLYPLELKQHIDRTFESDLVELFFVNPEEIDHFMIVPIVEEVQTN